MAQLQDEGYDRPRDSDAAGSGFRGMVVGLTTLLLVGGVSFAGWRFYYSYSNDERAIETLTDAELLRDRIDLCKHDAKCDQRILAALYVRLFTIEAEAKRSALKDSLDAYRLLIEDGPRDNSYYTWYIASFSGYERFRNLDLDKASKCERMALEIYDKAPPDKRYVPGSLLECSNIILSELQARNPVDEKEMHAVVERVMKNWQTIQARTEPGKLKRSLPTCARIFNEMGQRCESSAALADAVTCYGQAAAVFAAADMPKEKGEIDDHMKQLQAKIAAAAQAQAQAAAQGESQTQ